MLSLIFCLFATMYSTLGLKPVIRSGTYPFENVAIFEPIVVGKNIDVSFLRESELKHGRVAMLATVAFPVIEYFTHIPAVHQLDTLPTAYQLGLLSFTSLIEVISMRYGWVNPTEKLFGLRPDYQPGDFGLYNYSLSQGDLGVLMDKELNNGRLAMIGAIGMIAQELVTNQPIF